MERWDDSMDKLNAENLLHMREQQRILREQGNAEGVAQLEDLIHKVPVTDAIRDDPQGYLDSLSSDAETDRRSKPAMTPMEKWDASMDALIAENIRALRQEQEILREQGETEAVRRLDDFIAKLPVDDAFKAGPPDDVEGPTGRELKTGSQVHRLAVPVERAASVGDVFDIDTTSHYPGMYDRRDIGQPAESAGRATLAQLPTNDELVSDVNRFKRAYPDAAGDGRVLNLLNCSACVKAVDSRLAGVEPDAYAGFIADYKGGAFESAVTDAVMEQDLEQEWGSPIERGSTQDVEAALVDLGPGARGVLVLRGHVANVINRDGEVLALDGQTGDWSELKDYPMEALGWIRTDKPGQRSHR
jgi:hypothetical protein